jgi:hypothetical protein
MGGFSQGDFLQVPPIIERTFSAVSSKQKGLLAHFSGLSKSPVFRKTPDNQQF